MKFFLTIAVLVLILAYFQVNAQEARESDESLVREKRQFGFDDGFGRGGFGRGGFGRGEFGRGGFGRGEFGRGGFGGGFDRGFGGGFGRGGYGGFGGFPSGFYG